MAHTILLVEDDPSIQLLVKAILENEGYKVRTAETGADMYRITNSEFISLILLDLGLPDGDALPHIMKIREESAIPIIILTARQKMDDRLMALGLGANDYLTKPIHPKELTLRIRNLLSHKGEQDLPSQNKSTIPAPSASPHSTNNVTASPVRQNKNKRVLFGMLAMLFLASVVIFLSMHHIPQDAIKGATDGQIASKSEPAPEPEIVQNTIPEPSPEPEPKPAPLAETVSQPEPVLKVTVSVDQGDVIEEASVSKAEVLGYGWVLTSRCSTIPDVKWWKFKTHEATANYVLRIHSGDWDPMVENLTKRLAKLYGISDRNSSIVFSNGQTLKGRELRNYVGQFAQRLAITRCLANEAKIAEANP